MAAGPNNFPRAPPINSCHPGDLKPDGVARWLSNTEDYALLLEVAKHGADMHHGHTLPTGMEENRVPPHMVDEVTAQIEKELELGWLTLSPPTETADATKNAPIFAKQEPG